MSWDRPFGQPIPLPGGPPARTLRDAGNYIRRLPESERDKPEWRLAIQMLIDAAEDRGSMPFAKTGMSEHSTDGASPESIPTQKAVAKSGRDGRLPREDSTPRA